MATHYNAFISYKHAPEDNLVADAVHKGLEHFHIPGKLQKKTGIKKIDRIFRDKAELPITNDLSDNIADALEGSDYLIVLCSTNTKESAWVPREIDAFLKNHSKRDVFTVLVNGEPHDVIPEILQYEEREVEAADGSTQTVRIPIEPLSCDYRVPPRKAKKEELPRLICGLIGCSYDELINRRRQYRMKQLTAIFSVAFAILLGFTGYMIYSRNQIHSNYMAYLKNQSKYLAKELEILLEKEQRITALQLALEALPKDDEDDRPVTAEAVGALTDATLAYEPYDGVNIHAAWNYEMPNPVADFKVSSDGKYIAILDNGGVAGLWDTETHDRILYTEDDSSETGGSEDVKITATGIEFPDEKSLVMWDRETVICFDTADGKIRWNYALADDSFDERQSLMIKDDTFYIYAKNTFTKSKKYIELDTASGEVKNEISIPDEAGYEDLSVIESRLSPDHKKIAFRGEMVDWKSYAYGVLDIASKKAVFSDVIPEMVKDIGWIDDNTLITASTKIDNTASSLLGATEYISTDHSKLICLSASDLKEKWTADFICNGVNFNSDFVCLGTNSVAYFSGNVITVYDTATGTEKYSNNVNSSVLHVSDSNGNGEPEYITENGGYAYPAPQLDKDAVRYTRYFTDELRQVVISNGFYVRQNGSNEVIYYGIGVYDEAWTPLYGEDELSEIAADYLLDEKCLAVLSENENDSGKPMLSIYGLEGEAKNYSKTALEGDKTLNYQFLGVYNDRVYLGYHGGDTYDLVSVSFSGKDVKKEELFTESFKNDLSMWDGKLYFTEKNESFEPLLVIREVDSDRKTEFKLPEEFGFAKQAPIYLPETDAVYLKGEAEYVFDTEDGAAHPVKTPDGWGGAECISEKCTSDGFAVSDGRIILLADKTGEVKSTIRCPGVKPIGMTFIDMDSDVVLAVLYDDGSLYMYSGNEGAFIKKIDVSMRSILQEGVSFEYNPEEHLLFIRMNKLTDVVDTENGSQIACVKNSFGYHPGRDIFITAEKDASGKTKMGYYKRYSVDELIEKAKDILKNTELSEELKSRYGIY